MTVGAGQTGIRETHHVVVLGFGATGTTGRTPEGVVVAGRTGLRHQGVVTVDTIGDRASTQNKVMMLSDCGVTTGRCPEGRIVTEFTAIGRRNISGSAMAETTRDI